MFDLTGRKALVTGSTQGIGYAIAKAFALHGCEVFIHCKSDVSKAKIIAGELAESTGGSLSGIAYDLFNADAGERLYSMTGDVDILVCNASVQYRNDWDKIPEEEFESQVNVNFRSTLLLMQKYIPSMQNKRWGRVLNIGSVQQSRPHVQMAIYAATKSAIQNLTENTAKQLAGFNVNVNMLLPGVINTPRNSSALADENYLQVVMDKIPAGYIGEADDCSAAALLLCSDEGRYITGSALYIDGGFHL